ncbi:MAG: flavodoxin family protein [Candidatus Omnitrophica bacterium]|nr:flavodoxin family protein [Candidatus Omnitrophota bacterium]
MSDGISRRSFIGSAGIVAATGVVGSAVAEGSKEPLTVLGIACSHRKGKTTASALKVCLEEAEKVSDRIKGELIDLADLKIPARLAAGVPLEEGEKDDFPDLIPRIESPNTIGLIIGTPVYFGNMSALCKSFLERCIAFRKNNFSLSGKVAGVLAVGGNRNGGQELTIRSVQAALMSHQVLLVGDGLPTAHWGGTLWNMSDDDITQDEIGLATAKNLGRRVAEVALNTRD